MSKFETTRDMVLDLIVMTLKANAPKKSGNLSLNAIIIENNTILIGGDIAPYAKKTEETNKSSRGWIKNTIASLQPTIEAIFRQELKDEDIQEMINKQETSVSQQFETMANEKEQRGV